jgi:hypothetical protein
MLLRRIARYLMLYGSFPENIGLLNGKMVNAAMQYNQMLNKRKFAIFCDENLANNFKGSIFALIDTVFLYKRYERKGFFKDFYQVYS